jgi:type IV pilus assembly protein PilB
MSKHRNIGELLVQAGLIDADALGRALEVQVQDGVTLGRALSKLSLADEDQVAATIAERLQLEHLSPEAPEIAADVIALLPLEFCRKRMVAPLKLQGHTLHLAMADPLDYSAIQDAQFLARKQVTPVVASQTSIQTLLQSLHPEVESQKTYDLLANVKPAGEVEAAEVNEYEIVDPAKLVKNTKLPPVVRLVNLILSEAAKEGASDIHVEPQEGFLQVRYRVDGLLHDVLKVPRELQDSAISRLKIISGMDISERRRPQDGRSRLRFEGKRIDLRVSTLPTQFGEKVVIRLLDNSKARIAVEELGFSSDHLRTFQSWLTRPQGMVLVTGPTGSGKTSTLYAALNWVKSPTNNIITVEDPIEYQLPGVNQVQINPKAGVTFAAGLRSILRQDPNIIMVGEVRDRETASIALEAAQTGHLLLSTVHTNDAPATITRLIDLGVESFLVASSINGILAQRLVRKPCPACLVEQPPSDATIEKAGGADRLPAEARWAVGRGCEACRQTGYKGRIAIHELLNVTDEIRHLITRQTPEHLIRETARRNGMRTMMEDGIAKAAQGLTTLDEVVRTVAQDEASAHKEPPRAAPDGPGSARLAERAAPSVGNKRVLIVEDDPTTATVVKYFLELEGFEVLVAKDGLEGLETAGRERPDVIVSDIHMPGMDGITMVKALRADPATCEVAILLLTSDSSIESEAQALEVGADDYLVKPVEPRRLAARVKALLARTQGRQTAGME